MFLLLNLLEFIQFKLGFRIELELLRVTKRSWLVVRGQILVQILLSARCLLLWRATDLVRLGLKRSSLLISELNLAIVLLSRVVPLSSIFVIIEFGCRLLLMLLVDDFNVARFFIPTFLEFKKALLLGFLLIVQIVASKIALILRHA